MTLSYSERIGELRGRLGVPDYKIDDYRRIEAEFSGTSPATKEGSA